MKLKSIITIILLMLLFLLGVFIMKSGDLIVVIKQEFLNYLEDSYQVTLSVKETSFWPLNHLVLKKVEISTRDGQLLLSAPEVRVYYDLFKVLAMRGKGLESISYMEINEPVLTVKNTDFLSGPEGFNPGEKVFFKEFAPFEVKIVNGYLNLPDLGDGAELGNITLLLNMENEEKYSFSLNTAVRAEALNYEQYSLDGLNLNQLDLAVSRNEGAWQASLDTGNFPLQELAADLEQFFGESPLKLKGLKGEGRLNLNLSGRGTVIESYNGRLNLNSGRGSLELADYLPESEFSALNGGVLFSSRDKRILLEGMRVTLAGNPLELEGNLDYSATGIEGFFTRINSPELELSNQYIRDILSALPGIQGLPEVAGKARLGLTLQGILTAPLINIDINLPEGRIETRGLKQEIRDFKAGLRYNSGFIYLDQLRFNTGKESTVSSTGVYHLPTAEYALQLEGSKLKTALLQDYLDLPLLEELKGEINTSLALNGKGFSREDLSLSGTITATAPDLAGTELDSMQSGLWLADNVLFFEDGQLKAGESVLDFSGELDLNSNKLALNLTGKKIDSRLLGKFTGGSSIPISGLVSLHGTVSEELKAPLVKLELAMDKGSLFNYNFSDLSTSLYYQDKWLSFSRLELTSPAGRVQGSGYLELSDIYPYLEADLEITGSNFTTLEEFTGIALPLRGGLEASLRIAGSLKGPEITGKAISEETELLLNSRKYRLDRLETDFSWQSEQGLKVAALKALKGKTRLTGSGLISSSELGFDFQLAGLKLTDTGVKDLSGVVSLNGQLQGTFANPEFSGQITAKDIKYQKRDFAQLTGRIAYRDESLFIDELEWPLLNSHYLISGRISDLLQEPGMDLKISTERGELLDLIPYFPQLSPFPRDFVFKGSAGIKGSLEKPSAQLDLTFFKDGERADQITVKGEVAESLDLDLKGSKIDISQFALIAERGINLQGILDFAGHLSGKIDSFKLQLNSNLREARVSSIPIERISGEVSLEADRQLYLNQQLFLPDMKESSLKVKGNIPLSRGRERLDLLVDIHDIPLTLISSAFSSLPRLEGGVAGEFTLKGESTNPDINGRLELKDAGFYLGLPQPLSHFNGPLNLSGQEIMINNLAGKYGDKAVEVSGKVSPFDRENIWDLALSGSNLKLNYGSFKGEFDPLVIVNGPLTTPLIKAEINVHDLVAGYPFDWPLKKKGDSVFKPRLDLTFIPGQEVYFHNNNIDVLIQEGDLNLLYQDKELKFKGLLKSEQGSFNYYNNKFILTEAEASFKEYLATPELDIRATTRVSGTRIDIRLQGPADNLITTFTSQPPLTRDQILGLLTSRGGLGQFVFGNWGKIVQNEFFRIFADYFQADVVNKLRNDLQEALRLDRLEIDTYDLGWNQEVSVYLGKYLGEKTYLQYSGVYSQGGWDNELALRYYIDQNLLFEGSYRGNDDYSLSIKTEIEF